MVAMAEIDSDKIDATFWAQAIEGHAKRKAIICLDDVELDGSDACFYWRYPPYHPLRIDGIAAAIRCVGSDFCTIGTIYFFGAPSAHLCHQSKAALRVRKLACLFGKAFAPVADHIVVKWPTLLCRHALVLHEALPDVASVVIVRDAVEILASIEARPLGNMEGVSSDLWCGPGESIPTDPAPVGLALTAKVLAANCRWIAQSTSTPLVEYAHLPDVGLQNVAPHFGLKLTDTEAGQMQRAAGVDAKSSHRVFANDTNKKRREASPLAQELTERVLQPAIDEARLALPSV